MGETRALEQANGRIEVLPHDIGYRIKTTEGRHIEVHFMLFGDLHIVETYDDLSIGRGWCYGEPETPWPEHLSTVLAAAMMWDGGEDTEPEGWISQVGTGRRRPNGNADLEYVEP